ncbi:MAG: mannosyltransferase B-like protein [Candidatus Jorgensenbacteria bacterium GW2011_GWA1_48_11]|uniref:Mannosyltransferase B-like protein n=1 Tax=Candidatus Jorgensenbacteria bacterium GW2011_GWA1_48_11 TaxID=1618660 RepID=A0A0G1WLB7_9BACT|nr:MAG: mannosyltransferase B-like protein [Candidatus Jorgensenbacteria bacterium GW2011_GWA1_48_11]KKW11771.1 MAG: mannosyltransferase B-like protein [Candidatus Jorgensenbacteria bacterium GW2011_GWB1_49_9]
MKILVDVRLLSKGKLSGIEGYAKLLIDHLLEADSENQYVFFYNGFKKAVLPSGWTGKKNVRVVDWRVPNRLLDFSFRWLNWPKIDSFFEPAVVFSPHFNLLRLHRGVKRVITFHDLSFVHFPEFYPRRKRFWHWSQDYRRQAGKAAALTAVSEFTKIDLVETLGIAPEKIRVVYPGVNSFFSQIRPGDEALNKFAGQKELQCPFLLSVGVLEPRKNIPALIRAFGLLKGRPDNRDLKLVIVGERGWLYDTIFKEIQASPYKNQIVWWGRASFEDLWRLYNLASVFVYPSFFEGFGFPPLEAQACGLPVVASNRSSLPEILGDSALLHDPWRVAELAEAIEAVLANPGLAKTMREKGFKNVERFDWPRAGKTMLNLFNDLKNHA